MDLKSMSLMATLSGGLLVLGLLLTRRMVSDERSLRLWVIGTACNSACLVLVQLRGLVPDLASIVLANGLLMTGMVFLYLGNRSHCGLGPGRPWQGVLVAATALLVLHYTSVQPDLAARITVVSATTGLSQLASAVVLFRCGRTRGRLVRCVLALAFALSAGVSALRAVLAATADALPHDFHSLSDPMLVWTYLFAFSMNFVLAFCLPVLLLAKSQEKLAESERRYHSLYNTMTEGVALCELVRDADGSPRDYRFVDINPAFEAILGLDRSRVIGQTAGQVLGRAPHLEAVARVVDGGQPIRLATRYEPAHKHLSFAVFSPAPGQFAAVFQDITEHEQAAQRVQQQAHHDALTGLPNRRLLDDRLRRVQADLRRQGGHAALLFIDLDHFKALNDRHGHRAGDELLVRMARRLVQGVRETDTVARFGGDEFVVLLAKLDADPRPAAATAADIANKLRRLIGTPCLLGQAAAGPADGGGAPAGPGVLHRCTASIGLVVFGADAGDADLLLQRADAAMYQAKSAGRNRCATEAADGPAATPA